MRPGLKYGAISHCFTYQSCKKIVRLPKDRPTWRNMVGGLVSSAIVVAEKLWGAHDRASCPSFCPCSLHEYL